MQDRLVFDAESAAHLPIAPEGGVDVLVDPALAGKGRVGLPVTVSQLAGDCVLVTAGLDPAHRARGAGAGDQLQTDKDTGRRAEVSLPNNHAKSPFASLRTGVPIRRRPSRPFCRFEQIGELGL